ncbi:OpgC domain-containing protein [Chitinasiproducens palmae]|uniref:OpgC protein n=1 Tax=Chitinasiproducens palmae TaxID=1770053 RepID=A0A1H2PRQ2_9BURK|nr:OpgC domain-containing protein [Chitinasiproducens palmae]SDV49151.1 hypothetical protein SAMN05216551_107109 [Chitinasiproducens palmae]
MTAPAKRFAELDFFRGLALLIIVVDHIGGSILSRATLHAFALCDAAEVFVFLGGFAAAVAYQAHSARVTEAGARKRFMRRALQIYRAFLITAGLMLLTSAILRAFSIDAPNMNRGDLDGLIASPARVLRDILLLKRQPYLSAVLPMYVFFAAAVPFVLPLAHRRPRLLIAASVATWAAAPWLNRYLPSIDGARWDFNPFAWQLLFVMGALARCQPIHQHVSASQYGRFATLLAWAVAGAIAVYVIFVSPHASGGVLKQNLAWMRVISFTAIAWAVGSLIRRGWAARLADAVPAVGAIGRQGTLCFVGGAVISLAIDSVLFQLTGGRLNVPLGLLADALAIATLVAVSRLPAVMAALTPASPSSSR